MRAQIKPNFTLAKERYKPLLTLITNYLDFCYENGDFGGNEYNKLKEKIFKISGKNADDFNIFECFEEEGEENLAFDIALPEPNLVPDITKDELREIVAHLREFYEHSFDDEFLDAFYNRSDLYFHEFLKLNFKDTYSYKLFTRQKINGKFTELGTDEIVKILWGKR